MAIQLMMLKKLRESRGLKQKDIGDPPHISRIESGYIWDIPSTTITKLSTAFKMKEWEFVKALDDLYGHAIKEMESLADDEFWEHPITKRWIQQQWYEQRKEPSISLQDLKKKLGIKDNLNLS